MTSYTGTSADESLDLLLEYVTFGTIYDSVSTFGGADTIINYNDSSATDFAGIGADNSSIHGGNDNDTITLRNADNSTLRGGNGDDEIEVSSTDNALILGDGGNDTFTSFNGFVSYASEYQIHGTTNSTYRGGSGDDIFNLYKITNANVGGGGDNDTIIANFGSQDNFFKGDSGNDTFIVEGTNNTLSGGAGDDSITILNGDDKTFAYGNGGDDTISREFLEITDDGLGAPEDAYSLPADYSALTSVLKGGGGNDTILGGHVADDDTIDITSQETLIGGNGNDLIFSFGGNDKLYGQNGFDTLDGGNGDDFINGGSGNDQVSGGNGNDRVIGGSGDDLLADISATGTSVDPNGGDDRLEGGDGDDILVSSGGSDRLIGGADNDIFAFLPYEGGIINAIVNDFTQGEDLIAVLEAGESGTIAFALDISTITIYETSNGNTNITFDNGGLVQLKAFTGILITDFVL